MPLTRRAFFRLAGALGIATTVGVGTSSCALVASPNKAVIRGTTMGTYFVVTYVPGSETPPEYVVRERVGKHLNEITGMMSTYDPASDISRFNRFRKIGVPFSVSPDVITVVTEALRINKLTQGALDITVGPLVNLWGFGPDGRPNRVPPRAEIEKARTNTGIHNLEIDEGCLVKQIPDLYVDLSSIAKGFAVDALCEDLIAMNVDRYLVDIGGEVRGHGASTRGGPWRAAIERPVPHGDASVDRIIHLVNNAVATSGDYRNYYEENGRRYSHTIDPLSGHPITHNLASVSVMNASCMTADALATGFDVMGPEKGFDLAEKLSIPAIFIIKTGDSFLEKTTTAWAHALS